MTLSPLWNSGWMAALFDHLWQSTVVLLVAWLVTLALKTNGARIRYWVWMTASVKFLVPFALLSSIGAWWARPVAGRTIGSALYTTMNEISQPFQQAQAPAASSPLSASPAHTFEFLLPLLAVAWLCGVVTVLAVWALRAFARLRAFYPVFYNSPIERTCPCRDTGGVRAILDLLT